MAFRRQGLASIDGDEGKMVAKSSPAEYDRCLQGHTHCELEGRFFLPIAVSA
ncbi:hypothetical protein [Streptomyces sp. NPDC050164]|uniref:hypothetical protein n=1 Tax=Streptomyces sp. NPDC050164 TaxID=3365605 RepID=UPI0037B97285